MQLRRIISTIGFVTLCAFLFAACGTSSSASTTPTPTPTTVPTATPTPAPTTSTATTALIKTATATVNGTSETILTDAQGKTLYYLNTDTTTTSTCTGGCATNWPPLTGSGTPTSATTLSGKLTVVSNANGNQVQYNGHFLYTYAADTAPGQTKGQGVGNKWFVVTPDLAQM